MTGPEYTPPKYTPIDIEDGRRLFARDCNFFFGAATTEALPSPDLPEIAFAGRSNVGKSSLLNALTGRKSLARTSHTPGRTRELNFFSLDERIVLVDMPGYGYAKAAKADIAAWNATMRDYLAGRTNLARLFLLIDGRHGLKPPDLEMMTTLDKAALTYQLVFTKSDKVGQTELKDRLAKTTTEIAKHGAAFPGILVTSSRARSGVDELRAEIAKLAEPEPTR